MNAYKRASDKHSEVYIFFINNVNKSNLRLFKCVRVIVLAPAVLTEALQKKLNF